LKAKGPKTDGPGADPGGIASSRILLVLLAAGLVIRVVHGLLVWQGNPLTRQLIADALYYDQWSARLAAASFGGEAPFYLPPLYPFLLALVRLLFGSPLPAMLFLQGALGMANLYLIHVLTRRLFGARAAALAAGLGLLYAPFLFFETKLLATTVALFLGLLSLLLLQNGFATKRIGPMAAAGLVTGLLCEARPNFLLFAAAVLVLAVLRERKRPARAWPCLAALAAGLALPLTLSLACNASLPGEWILITGNGGINFYFGNHAGATGVNDAPSRDFSSIFDQGAAARRLAEQEEGRPLSQSEVSRHWLDKGWQEIRQDPGAWARLLVKKARLFLSDFGYGVIYIPEVERRLSWVQSLLIVPVGLILALGAAGLFAAWRARVEGTWLFTLFLAAAAATVLHVFMAERFRSPFIAGLLPFAGWALAQWIDSVRQRRFAGAALGAVAAAAFTALPFVWVDEPIRVNQTARARLSLGKAFLEQGNFEAARREVLDSLALRETAAAYYHLGLVHEGQGDAVEAEIQYEEASRRDPFYLEPLGSLAALHESRKEWDQALAARRRVIEIVPYRFEGYYNLGLTQIDAGRSREGIESLEKARAMATDAAVVAEALVKAYLPAGDRDKAREVLDRAEGLSPQAREKLGRELKDAAPIGEDSP